MAKKKPAGNASASDPVAKARTTASRVKLAGKTTRAKGHVSASTKRSQAKRDTKT